MIKRLVFWFSRRFLGVDVKAAVDIALGFGQIDGDHHKMWVIDQMLRSLLGDDYDAAIEEYRTDEDGEEYDWDEGVSP